MLLLLIFDAVERVGEHRQRFMHEGKETYPLPLPVSLMPSDDASLFVHGHEERQVVKRFSGGNRTEVAMWSGNVCGHMPALQCATHSHTVASSIPAADLIQSMHKWWYQYVQ
jgi:hypothetical protein